METSPLLAHFLLLHSVQAFPLNLVVEVKVALVEVVNTDITVLSATGVAPASGVGGNGVEGTEVASDTANFVFEDLVVEAGFKFALTTTGGGDLHSGLATTKNDKVLLGRNGGGIERRVARIRLEGLKITGRNELQVEPLLAQRLHIGMDGENMDSKEGGREIHGPTLAVLSLQAVIK